MRLFDLFESSTDLPSGIEEIVTKYRSNPPRNLFIRFPKGEGTEYIIPLKAFVRRTIVYQGLWDVNHAEIIYVKGRVLNLSTLEKDSYSHYAAALGIHDEDYTYEYLSSKLPIVGDSSPYGYVLYYLLTRRIKGGKVVNSRVSADELRRKLRQLRIAVLLDTSKSSSNAIIDHQYPTVGIVSDTRYVEVRDSVELDIDDRVTLNSRIEGLARNIASTVLNGELNTDDPFVEGPDNYFWTFDGMQIRITQTAGINDTMQGFLFDIETPYGILYHISQEGESDDDILKELATRYSRMNQPLVSWRPLDRDVFLHNHQMDYKDNSLRIIDLIHEVDKYYPDMRDYGRRYKIFLRPTSAFSPMNKSFLSGIIDVYSAEPSAREFIKRISNDGEIQDISILGKFFPRQKVPDIFTYDDLKKMAMIYDFARNNRPQFKGWRVFHHMK